MAKNFLYLIYNNATIRVFVYHAPFFFMRSSAAFPLLCPFLRTLLCTQTVFIVDERTFTVGGRPFIDDECVSADGE